LLDIHDVNINVYENSVKEGTYKRKRCKYISGKLTYTPTHYVKCGVKNTDFTVYKNGTQLSRITLPITGINPTYLLLQKERFMCQACQNSFTAKTPIVQRNCFISQNVKAQVILKSIEAQALTSIARDCSVSPATALRQINQAAKQFIPHYKALPKHLSFNEFKYAKGEMAFEYINAESGDILDYDPALKENYELYQELMESISNKDFAALSSCLTTPVSPLISNYMRTSLKR